MKHVITSAGILALGAAALHAYDPEMTRQLTGRPWTVAATVRGFYDDNPTTSPKNIPIVDASGFRVGTTHPQDTLGIEVSPSVHLNLPLEQTFIALGYIYSLKWYEDRDPHNTDQSHEFNGKLRHQFSPRHDIGVDDSFVVTSEPTVADKNQIITTPLRTDADILHNRGSIEDNIQLTQLFGLSLGYENNWYDYEQDNIPGQFASRSALLDRIEHLFRIDARFQVTPKLVGLVGYQFGINNYTGDQLINPAITDIFGRPHPALKSEDRDNYSHYIYAGADVDITARLRGSVRVGGQFTDYHELNESSANPYADASLTYVYLPGSSVEVGVKHTRAATDIEAVDTTNGKPTFDAEATAVYAQIIHRITQNFTGTLLGQYQNSSFNDGANDGKSEDLFLVGINFSYRFNPHFSSEIGYNFDRLSSEVGRTYERNRAYIGVRATY